MNKWMKDGLVLLAFLAVGIGGGYGVQVWRESGGLMANSIFVGILCQDATVAEQRDIWLFGRLLGEMAAENHPFSHPDRAKSARVI